MKIDAATVCAALLADSAVTGIIGTSLFSEMPPEEAAFPCLTYSESNSVALGGDNVEVLTSIVFDMECWHKASAWPMAIAVNNVMAGLGYVRNSAQDAGRDINGIHQVSLKFTNIKEG